MPESLTSASCIPLGYNYRGSMLLDPIQCLKDLVSLQKEGELAIQAYTQDVLKRAGLNTRYFDYTPSKVPVRVSFLPTIRLLKFQEEHSFVRQMVTLATPLF